MSENSESAAREIYVLKRDVVIKSLARIASRSVHRHFPGYLVVLDAARVAGRSTDLKPDFKSFFDRFFSVPGAPKKPYFNPFHTTPSLERRFLNENVSGSLSPRSLRPENPLRQLCQITQVSNGNYHWSLVPDHVKVASNILGGSPLPGASLAAFLYRDYGFGGINVPNASVVYECLAEDFGAAFNADKAAFAEIFADDTEALGQPFELKSSN